MEELKLYDIDSGELSELIDSKRIALINKNKEYKKLRNQLCEIKEKYPFIQMHGRMDDILSGAMGNEFYIARFEFIEDMEKFKEMVSAKADSKPKRKPATKSTKTTKKAE